MDITKRSALGDFAQCVAIKTIQTIIDYMLNHKKEVADACYFGESMDNVDDETLSAIQRTFDLMFCDDKRYMKFRGDSVSVSQVVEYIFFYNKNDYIEEYLSHPKIPNDAKRIFMDLNITMPMSQIFTDLTKLMDDDAMRNKTFWQDTIDNIKVKQNQYSNANEYFEFLKNMPEITECSQNLLNNTILSNENRQLWLRNQMIYLEYCEQVRASLSK